MRQQSTRARECAICANEIPLRAKKCTNCDSFQDWRGSLPGTQVVLSILAAVLTVTAGIVPAVTWAINYGSDTDVHVLGAIDGKDEQVILAAAVNRGNHASVIRGARLKGFAGAYLSDTELRVRNPEKLLVTTRGPADLRLGVQAFNVMVNPKTKKAYLKSEVAAELCVIDGFIEVDVEESGLWENERVPRQWPIDGEHVRPLVLTKLIKLRNEPEIPLECARSSLSASSSPPRKAP